MGKLGWIIPVAITGTLVLVAGGIYLSIMDLNKSSFKPEDISTEHVLQRQLVRSLEKTSEEKKIDYILWLDSDMVFEPDLLIRLLTDAVENDLDFVTGLCFSRVLPTKPTICKTVLWGQDKEGNTQGGAEIYMDYPKDQLFEIEGAGLACALVKLSVIDEIGMKCKMSPFQPLPQLSEDYSFCFRMKQLGHKMWCDSRVKVGHVGDFVFDEKLFLKQESEKNGQ